MLGACASEPHPRAASTAVPPVKTAMFPQEHRSQLSMKTA